MRVIVIGMIVVVAGCIGFPLVAQEPAPDGWISLDVPLLPGIVRRVYDGDTLSQVDVSLWPGLHAHTSVRLRGVDTPELRRAGCEEERRGAVRARDFVRGLVEAAQGHILISRPEHGRWAGRVVADVTVGGRGLADALIAAGLGRPYDGGTRQSWCSPVDETPRGAP